MWSVSLGFIGFIPSRAGGRRVHSGSLGPFLRVLGMVAFIRVGWVHLGAPLASSGSFSFIRAFISLIRAHPERRRVNSDSFVRALGSWGSFGDALLVVGFIRVRWVHSGPYSGLTVSFRLVQLYLGAPCGSSGSFSFFGFIYARFGGRRVHSRRVRSGAPLVLLESFGFIRSI